MDYQLCIMNLLVRSPFILYPNMTSYICSSLSYIIPQEPGVKFAIGLITRSKLQIVSGVKRLVQDPMKIMKYF